MSCCICRIWVSKYIFHFWHPMHPISPTPLLEHWNKTLKFSLSNLFEDLQKGVNIFQIPHSKIMTRVACFPFLVASPLSSVRSQSVKLIQRTNKRQRTDIWDTGFSIFVFILGPNPQIIRNSLENLDCSLRPSQSASIIQRINREMELKTFLCPLSLAR